MCVLTLPLTLGAWRSASFLWLLVSEEERKERKKRREGGRGKKCPLDSKSLIIWKILHLEFLLSFNQSKQNCSSQFFKLLVHTSLCDSTSITFTFGSNP